MKSNKLKISCKRCFTQQVFLRPLREKVAEGRMRGSSQAFTLIERVGQALPDNAPVKGHLAGFTLIELLVVVLIIGILAAVALPQYQKAVLKTRASTILGILSGLVQAEEVYFVSNGQYTTDVRLLDVEMPGECTLIEQEGYDEGSVWSCNNDFRIVMAVGGSSPQAIYCPKEAKDGTKCLGNAVFQLGFGASHTISTRVPGNKKYCWIPTATTKGREDVCKALGSPVTCGTKTCYEIY